MNNLHDLDEVRNLTVYKINIGVVPSAFLGLLVKLRKVKIGQKNGWTMAEQDAKGIEVHL